MTIFFSLRDFYFCFSFLDICVLLFFGGVKNEPPILLFISDIERLKYECALSICWKQFEALFTHLIILKAQNQLVDTGLQGL